MTLDETMIINNMTNVIKNLEQSKCICDIINDLNELILTLGRNHDMKHVPEPVNATRPPSRRLLRVVRHADQAGEIGRYRF